MRASITGSTSMASASSPIRVLRSLSAVVSSDTWGSVSVLRFMPSVWRATASRRSATRGSTRSALSTSDGMETIPSGFTPRGRYYSGLRVGEGALEVGGVHPEAQNHRQADIDHGDRHARARLHAVVPARLRRLARAPAAPDL